MKEQRPSFIHEVRSGFEFDRARKILEQDHQITLSRLRILTENQEREPGLTLFTSQIRIGNELTMKETKVVTQSMTQILISQYGVLSVDFMTLLEEMGVINLSVRYPIIEIPFTPYSQKWMSEQQKNRLIQMQERINSLASVSLNINLQSQDKTSPTILGASKRELINEDDADHTIEIFSVPSFSKKREEELAKNIISSFLSIPLINQRRQQMKLPNHTEFLTSPVISIGD